MEKNNIEKIINGISDLAVKNAIDTADSVSLTLTPEFLVVKFKNAQTLSTDSDIQQQEASQEVPQQQEATAPQQQQEVLQQQPGIESSEVGKPEDKKIKETVDKLNQAVGDSDQKMRTFIDQLKEMYKQPGVTEEQLKAFADSQQSQILGDIENISNVISNDPDLLNLAKGKETSAVVPERTAQPTDQETGQSKPPIA